mgnify:CR=1 FL=1
MCIAVPGKIIALEEEYAQVDIMGNRVRVFIATVPGAVPGDYVMVHAGYALQKVDEAEAKKTLVLLKEMYGHVA